MQTMELPEVTSALGALLVIYWTWLAIARLWLSPIAKFPGPKLAALTSWYEFYYDIICGGKFPFKLRELHAKYGPVVRITPDELSVSDPDFYAVLYTGPTRRRDKWKPVPGQKWVKESVAGSMSHEAHRMRRGALNPAFSTQRILSQHEMIDAKVDRFLERLDGFADSGETVLAWKVLGALTNDTIMTYCLGMCYNHLDTPSFEDFKDHDDVLQNLVGGHRMKQFGSFPRIVEALLFKLPPSFLAKMMPPFRKMLEEMMMISDQVRAVQDDFKGRSDKRVPKAIFEDILQSKLPAEEKAPERIAQDSMTVVVAGTHGTAFALATAIYYLLASPAILDQLKRELAAASPDDDDRPLSWKEAEQLPYLKGVVQEALRLSYGSSARLPRIAPAEALAVHDRTTTTTGRSSSWSIPPGTPIGMSAFQLHHDEAVFPKSHAFVPERWIAANPGLDRYMVSFTKGSRGCLGINLAYAMMFLTLARVFRAYGSPHVRHPGDRGFLELRDTKFKDVEFAIDGFLPLSRNGSHGLKIAVHRYE